MIPINFYSYKGGVGRTALTAQIARILAYLGKKVVIADLDFDAPGIPAVFNMNIKTGIDGGIWELAQEYQSYFNGTCDRSWVDRNALENHLKKNLKTRLDCYLKKVFEANAKNVNNKGSIFVLPSGVINDDYWKGISCSEWVEFLTAAPNTENSFIYFFLKTLMPLLKNEWNFDYLLVDSRAGITHYGEISRYIAKRQAMIGIVKSY